jgi:hypothetical protein
MLKYIKEYLEQKHRVIVILNFSFFVVSIVHIINQFKIIIPFQNKVVIDPIVSSILISLLVLWVFIIEMIKDIKYDKLKKKYDLSVNKYCYLKGNNDKARFIKELEDELK